MPSGGGTATKVTNNTNTDYDPAWSPDGTKLVYQVEAGNAAKIYTIPASGGTPTLLVDTPGEDSCPDWGVTASSSDSTAPTITLNAPADGAPYKLNALINAAYSCADETGLKSCTGPVSNGSPIDTSTTGTKTFSVTAEDNAGNKNSVTSTYYVTKNGKPPTSRGGGKGGGPKPK